MEVNKTAERLNIRVEHLSTEIKKENKCVEVFLQAVLVYSPRAAAGKLFHFCCLLPPMHTPVYPRVLTRLFTAVFFEQVPRKAAVGILQARDGYPARSRQKPGTPGNGSEEEDRQSFRS